MVSNGTGTFDYTPALGINGADSFAYTLTDDDNESDTATVTVAVTAVNGADGDLAPWGLPDGILNAADLLIMQRIVVGGHTRNSARPGARRPEAGRCD